jgi:hypothetical protein
MLGLTIGDSKMYNTLGIDVLMGKTITKIVGDVNSDELYFETSDGHEYCMSHMQDCCEHVSIEYIIGDLYDLIDSPIMMAEEASNKGDESDDDHYVESCTWTFYKLATMKGYVTIRWYGESNGYYSESVDFNQIK